MLFTLTALITYLILGLVGGTASEQIANRKMWPPIGWIGAILVAFGGAIIGAWLGSTLGFTEPSIFDGNVPIIPALIGMLVFIGPYFAVRAGYTPYGRKRTWQQKYRR